MMAEREIAMTAATLALIGATVVFSSFVSAVFGMAGGMVLLGVLLIYFDVATGMILFSVIQLATNGWRTLHWRQYVRWRIFGGTPPARWWLSWRCERSPSCRTRPWSISCSG